MTQLQKKWVGLDQVDGVRVLLDNNQPLRAKKVDGTIVDLMKLSPSDILTLKEAPLVPAPSTAPLALATVSQVTDLRDVKPDSVLYVSKLGNDTNSGSRAAPFLTVHAAQQYALSQGASAATPWLVKVGQGVFLEPSAFSFITGIFVQGEGKNPFNGTATSIRRTVGSDVAPILVTIPASGFPCYLIQDVTLGTPNGAFAGQSALKFTRDQSIPANINTYAGVTLRGSAGNGVEYYGCGAGADKLVLDRNASFSKLIAQSVWVDVIDASTIGGTITLGNTGAINDDNYRVSFDAVKFYSTIFHLWNSRVLGQVTVLGKVRLLGVASRFDGGISYDAQGTSPEIYLDAVSQPSSGVVSFTNGAVVSLITKASAIGYNPADASKWTVVPSNVKAGLDELVSRLKAAESSSTASTGTLSDNLNQEIADRIQADNVLQGKINLIESGFALKYGVIALTEDNSTIGEMVALSAFLPFSDDDLPTQLGVADFADGDLIAVKSGATSKIWKVIDDAGTKRVTDAGVIQLAETHGILVKYDLTDFPDSAENNALFVFSGDDLHKLADLDFGFATGIKVGPFGALSGADNAILSTDSINDALNKLASSLALRKAEIIALDGRLDTAEGDIIALDGRLDTAEGTIIANSGAIGQLQTDVGNKASRTLNNLTSPTSVNQNLLPDVPVTRRLGDLGAAWGSAYSARWGAPTATIDIGLVNGASGQNQVTMTSTAGISAIGIHNLFVPSLGITLLVTGVLNATTITVGANLGVALSNVQAYVIAAVSVRSENEVGSKPSGGAFIRSGTVVDGKSGNVLLQSGNSSNGSSTGDIQLLVGSTSNPANRGTLYFDAKEMQFNAKQLRNIANGSAPSDAVSKGQMETFVNQTEINMWGYFGFNTSNGVTTVADFVHTVAAFGTQNQTIQLPDQNVLMFGEKFEILNQSSGVLTLQRFDGSNLIVANPSNVLVVQPGHRAVVVNLGISVGFVLFVTPMVNYNGSFLELNVNNARVTNVQNAVNASDAVNKAQLEAAVGAIDVTTQLPVAKKESFTLNSTDISNGHIDLAKLVMAESVSMSSGRLQMIEGEDYTLSTVAGKTRITFIGDLVTPAPSALAAGDKVHFQYLYKASENA